MKYCAECGSINPAMRRTVNCTGVFHAGWKFPFGEQIAWEQDLTAEQTLTFTLTITLGNDGMQSPLDVANALEHTAGWIAAGESWTGAQDGSIRDVNGNTVGSWAVA